MVVKLRAGTRAVVLGCLFGAALLVVPATAGADTRGFDVTNYSSYQLRLKSVEPYAGFCQEENVVCLEDRPPTGDVLQPSLTERWELYAPFSYVTGAAIEYYVFDGEKKVGTERIHISYDYSAISHGYGGGMLSACSPTGAFAGLSCDADGWTVRSNTVKFYDAPGSVRTVPPSEAETQAHVLTGLCGENPIDGASCDFSSLEGPSHGFLPNKIVGSAYGNCEDAEEEPEFEYKDEVSNSNSVGLTIGTEVESGVWFEKATVSIEATYEHEWENSQTFIQKIPFHVKPGWMSWVTDAVPVTTFLGDYTIKLNGAIIRIPDVAFHRPDDARVPVWVTHTAQMNAAQEKSLCTGNPDTPGSLGASQGGLVKVPRSYIPTKKHKKQ